MRRSRIIVSVLLTALFVAAGCASQGTTDDTAPKPDPSEGGGDARNSETATADGGNAAALDTGASNDGADVPVDERDAGATTPDPIDANLPDSRTPSFDASDSPTDGGPILIPDAGPLAPFDGGPGSCPITSVNAAAYSFEYHTEVSMPNPVACQMDPAACTHLTNSCCYNAADAVEWLCIDRLP